MKIYRDIQDILEIHQGGSIAIGNFDGVHRGHQAVIQTAGNLARRESLPWGVLTFEPHPKTFFQKEKTPFRLTPFLEKARYIEDEGVDFLVVLEFNDALAHTRAEAFVSNVLLEGFAACHVVSGDDFVFGHNRGGTVDFLKVKGRKLGFGCTSVGQVEDDGGEVISSTRVRELLSNAKPGAAAQLLGHGYEIAGEVVRGDQRGRTIGFPTANLIVDGGMRPSLGGYAVRAGLVGSDGIIWHDGIANLGYRPTFGGDACLLETHLFDFAGDIYGKTLRVSLVDYIRPEQKFDGIEALKAQIDADCGLAREMLANKGPEFS
jgi:riboflavin kinase/FMN adenylyltransferase